MPSVPDSWVVLKCTRCHEIGWHQGSAVRSGTVRCRNCYHIFKVEDGLVKDTVDLEEPKPRHTRSDIWRRGVDTRLERLEDNDQRQDIYWKIVVAVALAGLAGLLAALAELIAR